MKLGSCASKSSLRSFFLLPTWLGCAFASATTALRNFFSFILRGGIGSLAFVGVMNTAYFAHLNVPAYWRSWCDLNKERAAEPKALLASFRRVIYGSLGLTALLYAVLMFAGASTFGAAADSRLALMRYASGDAGAAVER